MVDVNTETDNSQIEGGDVNYSEQLTKITDSINNLSDQTKDNDEKAKEELQKILNGEFINNLKGYLDKNPTELANLQNSLISILNSYPGDKENDEAYTSLKKLATTIGLQENDGKWSKEYQETADNVPKKPTLNLTGELTGIKSEESDKKQTGNDGLVGLNRDAPEGEETLPNDENLYRTIQTIDTQLGEVEALLENDKLSNDNTLKKTQDGLKTAKTVIDYTTIDNVKILQNFISENLTGQDKADFDSASKKGDSFDGKFGKGTLKGVNIILKKTDEYISGMKNYLNTIQKQEIEKINDPNDIKNIEKGGNITAEHLLQINNVTLPDGASVNFADGEEAKLNTSGSQEIKLEIKLGEDTVKTITVKVNIEDTATKSTEDTEESTESNKSAEPLKFNEGTYRVMKDKHAIATKVGLPSSAIFYSTIKCESEDPAQQTDVESGSQQIEFTEKTGVIDKTGDVEYYVRLPNHPEMIYKVKVDSLGYLCPIAEEINTKLKYSNGSNVKTYTLFMNNESCMQYLKNKLPGEIRDKCVINWNPGHQDYQLVSYDHWLTIEPMTIAGDWISKGDDHLSKSLAFLNLANYTRSIGVKYDSPDPDVNRRVSKIRGIKYEGKKVHMDISNDDRVNLGLGNATPEELARFKRYNNGEQWEENRNDKRKNVYKKINL